MPRINASFENSVFQLGYPIAFGLSQVPISQTAVALKMNVNAATSGSMNLTGFPAQFAGSIVGVSVVLTANKTAGVLTVTPTINGTAITTPAPLVAVAVANTTLKTVANTDAQQTGARFNAGDLLGVKLTSDGSLAPTTNDCLVFLTVLYENVQV